MIAYANDPQKGDYDRESLDAGTVPQIFEHISANAGLSEYVVAILSGHSTRVGAAQDIVAAGLEVTEVMQAGGWKSLVHGRTCSIGGSRRETSGTQERPQPKSAPPASPD